MEVVEEFYAGYGEEPEQKKLEEDGGITCCASFLYCRTL
jgi:hypothetical protein